MLKLFRKNQFLRSLLLLPLAAVLNINLLIDAPTDLPVFNYAIDSHLYSFFAKYPQLNWIGYSLLLFVGSVLLNRMVIINRLSNIITLYPGLFFILIASAFPAFGSISVITIGLLLLLLMLSNIMYVHNRGIVSMKIFNTGIYLGIMILLFLPLALYLIVIIIGINKLTRLKRKTLFNLFNGILVPFYLVVLYHLIFGLDLKAFVNLYDSMFGMANLTLPFNIQGWLTITIIVLYLLIALINHSSVISKKSIQTIRKVNILAWCLVCGLLIHLVSGMTTLHDLVLLTPVLGYYTSDAVIRFKSESNGELVFVILVILCVILPLLGF